jgi:hypothetical protein
MDDDLFPSTHPKWRDTIRHSIHQPMVSLGHSYLARNRTSPIRHIVVEGSDGWVQLCTGQRAIRSHAGRPRQSSCAPCRKAHAEAAAA